MGLIVLFSLPAHAVEKQIFGDVEVGPGIHEDDISTSFGDVTVNGTVVGDVRSAFGDVEVNRRVKGNVEAGKGDIEIHAPVEGAVDAGFGNVHVNSVVEGDVNVGRGDVRLGPEAVVRGDVHCGSGEVSGKTNAVQGTMLVGAVADRDDDHAGSGPFGRLVGWAFATAAFVALSVLAAVVAPGTLTAMARRAEESPGWSLLLGVASVPTVIILFVVFAITLVGIPLVLLLAPAYLALVFFGALVAAFFLGRKVVLATGRYRGGNALAAAVGALILAAATLVPVVGDVIVSILALLGTGATILALISRRPRSSYPSYEAYVRDRRDV
ncbi:MAG TPA: polymer-forming cytoskeletal protein [Rubrobacteraceae bacterium]|nr:polymer-forming cytoskeletal protein [Rubrobacteraceae bacterium]